MASISPFSTGTNDCKYAQADQDPEVSSRLLERFVPALEAIRLRVCPQGKLFWAGPGPAGSMCPYRKIMRGVVRHATKMAGRNGGYILNSSYPNVLYLPFPHVPDAKLRPDGIHYQLETLDFVTTQLLKLSYEAILQL
jgi:hypothetical protein